MQQQGTPSIIYNINVVVYYEDTSVYNVARFGELTKVNVTSVSIFDTFNHAGIAG